MAKQDNKKTNTASTAAKQKASDAAVKKIVTKTAPAVAVKKTAPAVAVKKPAAKPAAKKAPAVVPATKVTVKVNADMLPTHDVKNLKGLRNVMDLYPNATGYSVEYKFGIDIINLLNMRGRKIAEVRLIQK